MQLGQKLVLQYDIGCDIIPLKENNNNIIISISSASQTLYHHHNIRLKCEQTVRGEGEAQFPKMLRFQHNNNDTHYSTITIHTIQTQYTKSDSLPPPNATTSTQLQCNTRRIPIVPFDIQEQNTVPMHTICICLTGRHFDQMSERSQVFRIAP